MQTNRLVTAAALAAACFGAAAAEKPAPPKVEGYAFAADRAAYWDADVQRELVMGGRIFKFAPVGMPFPLHVQGRYVATADVLGDWREEIITSVPGEMRIYTTTIPADRRVVCLMQDPIYRMDVAHAAMGYYQVPMLSCDLASRARAEAGAGGR